MEVSYLPGVEKLVGYVCARMHKCGACYETVARLITPLSTIHFSNATRLMTLVEVDGYFLCFDPMTARFGFT